jgi:Mor family transcriptional regulator
MADDNRKLYRRHGPELLTDLAQSIAAFLQELIELDQERSVHVGEEIANRVARHWGGQLIYVPIGIVKMSERDMAIWNEFDGRNHSDLARKHGVSLQWIYKIVKDMRQAEMARRQHNLFPEQG